MFVGIDYSAQLCVMLCDLDLYNSSYLVPLLIRVVSMLHVVFRTPRPELDGRSQGALGSSR